MSAVGEVGDQPRASAEVDASQGDGAAELDAVASCGESVAALPTTNRRWRVGVLTVTGVVIAGCIAAAISAIVPSRTIIPGLPDAGTFTALSLPAVKALFDLMAAATVGWLLAAAALAPPQRSGLVDVAGYRALRAASLSATVWAASALALVPLTLSDTQGRPVSDSLSARAILTALGILDNMRGPAIVAGIAIVIAIAARIVMRPVWAFVLLAIALVGMLPMAIAGHTAQAGDHDIAVDSLLYHLVGVTVWVGGLIAFIGLTRQGARRIDVIARRYSTVALLAFVSVAGSGVINAAIRLPFLTDLWRTDYGRLVLVKSVLVVVLGVIGFIHRRRTLPSIRDNGDTRPLIRLASVEVVIMSATIGVAAALARTATPPDVGVVPSNVARVLGYDLPGPPTAWNLLTYWRFDLVAGTAAIVAAALYVWGVVRLRRRGDSWPVGRTIAWLVGCLILLLATSSGFGAYGHAQFSVHMMEHMFLAMLVPIFLVLGGPVTLILRALPASGSADPPGVREAVVALVHSRVSTFLTHPLIVFPLFVGSFYVLYFTELYSAMISTHVGHLLMTIHFVLSGYLYYWVVIGIDPAPRQLSSPLKLALVLVALPFHAFFGLALMSSHQLLASNYVHDLALPWVTDALADQQLGGGIGWGFTEIPLLVVMIALVSQWARSDERESKRKDRQADRDQDAELNAYNAMLATIARRDQPR